MLETFSPDRYYTKKFIKLLQSIIVLIAVKQTLLQSIISTFGLVKIHKCNKSLPWKINIVERGL